MVYIPPASPRPLPAVVQQTPLPRPVNQQPAPTLRPGGQQPVPTLRPGGQQPVPTLRPGGQQPVPTLRPGSQQPVPTLRPGSQQPVPTLRPGSQQPVPTLRPGSQQPAPTLLPGSQQPTPTLRPGSQQPVPTLRPGSQQPAPTLYLGSEPTPTLRPESEQRVHGSGVTGPPPLENRLPGDRRPIIDQGPGPSVHGSGVTDPPPLENRLPGDRRPIIDQGPEPSVHGSGVTDPSPLENRLPGDRRPIIDQGPMPNDEASIFQRLNSKSRKLQVAENHVPGLVKKHQGPTNINESWKELNHPPSSHSRLNAESQVLKNIGPLGDSRGIPDELGLNRHSSQDPARPALGILNKNVNRLFNIQDVSQRAEKLSGYFESMGADNSKVTFDTNADRYVKTGFKNSSMGFPVGDGAGSVKIGIRGKLSDAGSFSVQHSSDGTYDATFKFSRKKAAQLSLSGTIGIPEIQGWAGAVGGLKGSNTVALKASGLDVSSITALTEKYLDGELSIASFQELDQVKGKSIGGYVSAALVEVPVPSLDYGPGPHLKGNVSTDQSITANIEYDLGGSKTKQQIIDGELGAPMVSAKPGSGFAPLNMQVEIASYADNSAGHSDVLTNSRSEPLGGDAPAFDSTKGDGLSFSGSGVDTVSAYNYHPAVFNRSNKFKTDFISKMGVDDALHAKTTRMLNDNIGGNTYVPHKKDLTYNFQFKINPKGVEQARVKAINDPDVKIENLESAVQDNIKAFLSKPSSHSELIDVNITATESKRYSKSQSLKTPFFEVGHTDQSSIVFTRTVEIEKNKSLNNFLLGNALHGS